MPVLNPRNYRSGYSLGVGGVVLCGDKALLVRAATGRRRGEWMIPGGFVEPGETIDVAVRREVREETGVEAEIEGIVAVRNRLSDGENSAYFIFQLRAESETARPDEVEVDRARYFTLAEMERLPRLNALSKLVVAQALLGDTTILNLHPHPTIPADEYTLYL